MGKSVAFMGKKRGMSEQKWSQLLRQWTQLKLVDLAEEVQAIHSSIGVALTMLMRIPHSGGYLMCVCAERMVR